LGHDGRPKTGKSKRDVVIHANLLDVLRNHQPFKLDVNAFVFTTANGAPISQANFFNREWAPMLEALGIRRRPFYNTRHTYITYLLALGVAPLFIARQTGTSLEMIEDHYGSVSLVADTLDGLIRERETQSGNLGNLPGTLPKSLTFRRRGFLPAS